MLIDFFTHFLLKQRDGSIVRRTAWLSIIGLAVSLSALLIVMSVMAALNANIRDRILSIEPHLIVQNMSEEQVRKVLGTEVRINSYETQDAILRTMDGRFRGTIARGVDLEQMRWLLSELQKNKKSGSVSLSEDELGSDWTRQVIIGSDLAHALGVFENENLLVFPPEGLLLPPAELPPYEKVLVKKIISSNVADVDAQLFLYVQGKSLRALGDTASLKKGYEVRLKDPDHVDGAKKDLLAAGAVGTTGAAVHVETWKDRNSALLFALRLEKIIIGLFLGMAALVAILSMVSVLTLLISQKKREIGLLQALGLSKKSVQNLFMKLGLLTSAAGVFLGMGLGLVVSLIIERHPLSVLPDIYYDSQIPALVQWGFVLLVFVFALFLSFLGAWVASRHVSEYSPALELKGS